jgi:ATP phosphoribosyltransferase regulatory subunit HisZ
MKLAL